MNHDLPDWIIEMKQKDEDKMKLHNEKVDELMNEVNRMTREVNGMVGRISDMINDGKKMKNNMQKRLDNAIRRWLLEKKKK